MALIKPDVPAKVTAVFIEGLPAFLAAPQFGAGCGSGVKHVGRPPKLPTLTDVSCPSGISAHDAQEIVVLRLDALSEGAMRETGRPCWRIFAGSGKYRTVMGRVTHSDRPRITPGKESNDHVTTPWRLTAAFYGDPASERDRVWDILQASQRLAELPEVREEDYRMRVLSMPGLNLEAFHLLPCKGGEELAIPFPARPCQTIAELNTATVYRISEFVKRVAPLAKRVASAAPTHGC